MCAKCQQCKLLIQENEKQEVASRFRAEATQSLSIKLISRVWEGTYNDIMHMERSRVRQVTIYPAQFCKKSLIITNKSYHNTRAKRTTEDFNETLKKCSPKWRDR